ncbi:MAG TPA: SMP-30/gluconolactonase/LRE family protein [Bradyrhizobium sp.]|nr:SMP-30/gluconolactonase/LRE family protein [Bradyrhizobium sp.]
MNRKPRSSCIDRTAIADTVAICCLAAIYFPSTGFAEELFVSKPLTPKDEYTSHIEGPAVNAAGDLFVVNIKIPGAGDKGGGIGRMKNGTTTSELFAPPLPNNGVGNGIRFDLEGRMYVADFPNHVIHVFEAGSTTPKPYFATAAFNQPNDLAIARDGTIYASDPKGDGTGRIWKITKASDGTVTGKIMTPTGPRRQGKTNGLDLSPDNKTLYVSESRFASHGVLKAKAAVYAYRIDGLKLADERKLIEFPQKDVDGLRVDTDGRIFVARPDAGEVAIIVPPGSPGAAHAPVKTTGLAPTNLTFGGADGRDVFVTQADKNNILIERFRTDRPGREPCLQTPAPADCRAIAP